MGACTLAGMLLKPDSALEFTIFHVGDAEVWINLDGDVARVTVPQQVQRPSKRDPSKMVTRLAAAMGAKPTVTPVVQQFDASGSGGLVLAPRRPNEERFNTKPDLPHYSGSEDCTLQTSSTELENTGGSFKICKYVEYVVNVGTVPLVPHNAQCPIE